MWRLISDDVDSLLKKLGGNQDRLPISLRIISALVGISSEKVLARELRSRGCVIEKLGGEMDFLISLPQAVRVSPPEFVPQIITIRDRVLKVMNWDQHDDDEKNIGDDQVNIVSKQQTCRHVSFCGNVDCTLYHYEPDIRPCTDPSLGFCSYLNLCKKPDCRYLHFMSKEPVVGTVGPPARAQWIQADIRSLDLSIFHSLVRAIVLDPPWDIHMELSYGTMTDDEMRSLNVGNIHDEQFGGFVFVWATVRALEVARECIREWGYEYVDETIWVKTNQIGGTVRSGRTGHWFNHNKEHCLIGMKGDVSWSNFGLYRKDCDVIVSPVRETSRKPDELYALIERMVGVGGGDENGVCLELFGRPHNLRDGWITVGNQLSGTNVSDPILVDRMSGREGGHVLV